MADMQINEKKLNEAIATLRQYADNAHMHDHPTLESEYRAAAMALIALKDSLVHAPMVNMIL